MSFLAQGVGVEEWEYNPEELAALRRVVEGVKERVVFAGEWTLGTWCSWLGPLAFADPQCGVESSSDGCGFFCNMKETLNLTGRTILLAGGIIAGLMVVSAVAKRGARR